MAHYFSFAEQSRHYFDRPDEGPRLAPVDSPAAWRGGDLAGETAWREVLPPDAREELRAALACALATGRPTGALEAADFPLPRLSSEIARWRRELVAGRGFLVVAGVPVDEWSDHECETAFWCLGLHLGRPGAQNARGDLLGHVRDTGRSATDPYARLYETSAAIAYHCDAADVVGLLCLRGASQGGASRIASSVAVFNQLLAERPDLAPRLFEPFALDLRNEDASGRVQAIPVPPCRFAGGRLRTFYHSDYFRSAQRHRELPRLTREEQELLDLYEEIASRPALRLDMQLQPGEIQWLSNHTVIHARTAYRDPGGAAAQRHLLRLWLSIE